MREICDTSPPLPQWLLWAGGACVFSLCGLMGYALHQLPELRVDHSSLLQQAMQRSGIGNSVTAALLDFRGYDTLLELEVLLLAVIAVFSHPPTQEIWPARYDIQDPAITQVVQLLLPLCVMVAGYLLWAGTDAHGGAFQAAAVLAGGATLCLLTLGAGPLTMSWRQERVLLVLGPFIFLMVALFPLLRGLSFLQYPSNQTAAWMLVIESTATLSIAWMLLVLFAGRSLNHSFRISETQVKER